MGKWKFNLPEEDSILEKETIDIKFRRNLEISSDFTFGLEMETEYANYFKIKNYVESNYGSLGWNHCLDRTLNSGIEVTTPILTNNLECWKQIESMCNFLDANSKIGQNCGSHIHLGFHVFENNPTYLYNFLLLWVAYEDVIYKFLYGEYDSHRKNIIRVARPIATELIIKLNEISNLLNSPKDSKSKLKEILLILNNDFDRYKGLNLCYLRYIENYDKILNKNTIEIRCPNGTLNEAIWQNNVNFLVHLIMYAKSKEFDSKYIISRIISKKENKIYMFINNYSRIDVDDAKELSELIYSKELDKLNFLKQYLKSSSIESIENCKSK